MANELMYAQFLDRAGDMTGTSMIGQIAAQKAQEDALNAQNLANEGLADFSPGEFDANEMLDEAGWAGYGPMDVVMGAAMKPITAQIAQQGIDWTKKKIGGKASQEIVEKAAKKATGKGLAKGALKLGGKAASRLIPGVGWVLGAADLIDYFGFPIYDYVPGGDYLTWRDTD